MMDKIELPLHELFGLLYWPALPAMLISTIDPDGRPTVAPFSVLSFPSYRPLADAPDTPIVITAAFAANKRTYRNIRECKEFVVNVPSVELVEHVNRAGFPAEDKFVESGLTPIPSLKVQPPSVAECKISFECELMKIDDLKMMMDVVWGRVIAVRVDADLYEEKPHDKLRLLNPLYHQGWNHDDGTFYALGDLVMEEVEPE